MKYVYNVNLGKRFNHIVAEKLAIKQRDVIAYRNNTVILCTSLDLLDDQIKAWVES